VADEGLEALRCHAVRHQRGADLGDLGLLAPDRLDGDRLREAGGAGSDLGERGELVLQLTELLGLLPALCSPSSRALATIPACRRANSGCASSSRKMEPTQF
jgi:hypothetical protein